LKYHNDSYVRWLGVSTDYGQTLEFVKDGVFQLRYNADMETMLYMRGATWYVSHDDGITGDTLNSVPGFSWKLIPDYAFLSYYQYSETSTL